MIYREHIICKPELIGVVCGNKLFDFVNDTPW